MDGKPPLTLRLVATAIAAALVFDPLAFAQQPAPPQRTAQEVSAAQPKASGAPFSQQDLDELL